jgi:hypothetical protein
MNVLTTTARETINTLAALLFQFNAHPIHSDQRNTLGHIYNAINSFVLIETGIDISSHSVNWHGWKTFADDVQALLNEIAGN